MIKGILIAFLLLITLSMAFYFFHPVFGASQTKEDFKRYSKVFSNIINEKFYNNKNIKENIIKKSDKERKSTLKDFLNSEDKRPQKDLKPNKLNREDINNMKDFDITWFGHSTFLLKLDNKNILYDPMFSERPSPVPFLIDKRYSKELSITPEELPEIDIVFISHDHYDHLDYKSIKKLNKKVKNFYVPLGVKKHLVYWGVEENKITEMTWWEEQKVENLNIVLTPAYHFSGRKIGDRNQTLWGSWLVQYDNKNIYFSGDTGYAQHFEEIYKKYGSIDFALMECGQYNYQWKDIHMHPEETVQASIDLDAKLTMPIHWGAFTLSIHKWNEPVKRFVKEAKNKNKEIIVPQIGEIFNIKEKYNQKEWWKL